MFRKPQPSESVKCRFSKCRFSALNLKFDFISDGGCTREKQIQKALGSLPPCGNRCRFSESAICSSRVHPPSEIKSNFKFKTLRWRPLRWRLTLSETPTTWLKSTAVHLQFVRQYAPHLYRHTFLTSKLRRKGNPAIRLPFVLGSTPPICTAVRPPFVRQYFWKNTGGWGHRNVSDSSGDVVERQSDSSSDS